MICEEKQRKIAYGVYFPVYFPQYGKLRTLSAEMHAGMPQSVTYSCDTVNKHSCIRAVKALCKKIIYINLLQPVNMTNLPTLTDARPLSFTICMYSLCLCLQEHTAEFVHKNASPGRALQATGSHQNNPSFLH